MYLIRFAPTVTDEQRAAIVEVLESDQRLRVHKDQGQVRVEEVSKGLEISGVYGICHGRPGFVGVTNMRAAS